MKLKILETIIKPNSSSAQPTPVVELSSGEGVEPEIKSTQKTPRCLKNQKVGNILITAECIAQVKVNISPMRKLSSYSINNQAQLNRPTPTTTQKKLTTYKKEDPKPTFGKI